MRAIPRTEHKIGNPADILDMITSPINKKFCYFAPVKSIEEIPRIQFGGILQLVERDDNYYELFCIILKQSDVALFNSYKDTSIKLSFLADKTVCSFLFTMPELNESGEFSIPVPESIYCAVERFHPRFDTVSTDDKLYVHNISLSGIQIHSDEILNYKIGNKIKLVLTVPVIEKQADSDSHLAPEPDDPEFIDVAVYATVQRKGKENDIHFMGCKFYKMDFYTAIHLDSYVFHLRECEASKTRSRPMSIKKLSNLNLLDRFKLYRVKETI